MCSSCFKAAARCRHVVGDHVPAGSNIGFPWGANLPSMLQELWQEDRVGLTAAIREFSCAFDTKHVASGFEG